MRKKLSVDTVRQYFHWLNDNNFPHLYDPVKHQLNFNDEKNQSLLRLRLPLHYRYDAGSMELIHEEDFGIAMVLIQAGSCALGYFAGEDNLAHKVVKSYMVRKKQGKSQIKYLKTKGKSRAGSRVRLSNTEDFFTNISTKLEEYFDTFPVDCIALSCSKTLWPFFFTAKNTPPFDAKDERIIKIPKHVHTPNYEVLIQTHHFLMHGEIQTLPENEDKVAALLKL